jgi:cellulose synthase/poly-beta-1,6-N-acetylglucosamine synthase-like glycosyltransferase
MTDLDQSVTSVSRTGARPQRVVINRAPEPSEVQRRLERERKQLTAGVVDPAEFAIELAAEFDRRSRGGRNCMVGTISIFEMPGLLHQYGPEYVFDRVTELIALLHDVLKPMDIVTVSEHGEILIMARESRLPAAINRVERLCKAIAGRRFDPDGEGVLLTPSAGVATLDDGTDPADVVRRAVDARELAAGHLDLRVHRWEPAMSADTAPEERQPFDRFRWQDIKERLRAPVQILSTYVLGLFIPFCIYWGMANVVGLDITYWMYLAVVATLVLTGVMILVEAQLAVHQKEPPEVDSYPEATAIICAYLPNEAATIMGTLDAFLNLGYPGGLQVILAYNTPNSMPVERELAKLAEEHPNLDVVRVEGSTSKAQNVNAVLAMARGEFTGMFDADHEPRPGSFERSWRWLANGYDVVQGHCMTRNGEETLLARMIAVEFESIYAVAHPGRAKLHRFGVFGGSNGYWRTSLLHETRMRGSMLTEDIDSSMRTVERGLKIRSDRDVVSRELATTTFQQVWNQRLRWAQGWFQVTMMHTLRVWKSPGLTFRQKFGASYLLGYRELYPWLSLQIFPLVAYWLTRGDTLSYGWPVFFCTTLFVLHIGPVQTWYAYRLADWEIKQHKSWFWAYLFFSTIFYTEYKNTIARVAHIKEFVGERAWKVTPRSDAPIEFEDEDDVLDDDDHDASDAPADGSADGPLPVVVQAAPGLPRRPAADESIEPDVERDHEPDVERLPAVVDAPPMPRSLPGRRPGTADDPPMPRRREPSEVRADGLPQRAPNGDAGRRVPSSNGRLDGLDGRALPRRSADETSDEAAVGAGGPEVESERLARRAAGLIPTAGLVGEPLLAPRSPRPTRSVDDRRPVQPDESLISARVRELVERPMPRRTPPGEPLLAESEQGAERVGP